MKLKHLLPFIVSMIFFSYVKLFPKSKEVVVLKQQLPYEITNVEVSSDKLIIEGWGFINGNQHFIDASTHSISIEFSSNTDVFKSNVNLLPKDMSSLMYYRGARECGLNEYYQPSSKCNYSYKNVGFKAIVPLERFKKNEKYTAMLVVLAKQTNTTYKIQVYYPMLRPLIRQIGDYQFSLESSLKDTKLIINHDNVVVRSGPSASYPVINYGPSCGDAYKNSLFYQSHQIFSNIIEKINVNDISVYRLKGDLLSCKQLKQRVKEGSTINPMYIASTFVEYSGTMLTIQNKLINDSPVLTVEHPIIALNDAFNYKNYATAYDPEELDLTSKIQVLSNNYQNKIGQYQIVLYVEDKYGYSDQKTMNVTVEGPTNAAPHLIAHDRIVKQFSYFDPLEGVEAFDIEDGELTSQIKLLNFVSTDNIGIFNQCYQVSDSMNAQANKCVSIHVIKRNEIVNYRFINLKINDVTHSSWNTYQRELYKELNNTTPISSKNK